jgi:hypothetical protein
MLAIEDSRQVNIK